MKGPFLIDYPELFALNAIVEKVERAVTNESEKLMYIEREAYMLIVFIGVVLLIISSAMYTICLWHSNHSICSRQSEIDLSVTDTTRCHEEEKTNNLQNEENFRRYANPLKNSTCSLRSSSNVELNPIQDHQYAGTSNALSRSQLSILKNPTSDFTNTSKIVSASPSAAMMVEYEPTSKGLSSQSLYKTQNFDVDKNTIHGIESQQSSKDFDKCINKVDFKFFSAAAAAAAAVVTTTQSSSPNHINSNHHHHHHNHHSNNINSSNIINNNNNISNMNVAAVHQQQTLISQQNQQQQHQLINNNNNNSRDNSNVNSNDTLTLHI
jgi:jagged-1